MNALIDLFEYVIEKEVARQVAEKRDEIIMAYIIEKLQKQEEEV